MPKLREIKACSEAVEQRRQTIRTVADPMELARLAIDLKPSWASGNPEQQRQALLLARKLFDQAIEVAVMPSDAELKQIRDNVQVAAIQQIAIAELADGCLNFDPESRVEDDLQRHLAENGIKVPKAYKNGRWSVFIQQHKFECKSDANAPVRYYVAKKSVDTEIRCIKREDADRKATKRRIGAATKVRSSK